MRTHLNEFAFLCRGGYYPPENIYVGNAVLVVPLRFKSCETNGRTMCAPTKLTANG